MTGLREGQVRRLTGASKRQLRYWAKVGLAVPSVQDSGGVPGVPRLYDDGDVAWIREVVELRRRGVSIQQQRRMLCSS